LPSYSSLGVALMTAYILVFQSLSKTSGAKACLRSVTTPIMLSTLASS